MSGAPRQIVLDTETTGLEPQSGHRIIEIGAVEISERRPTGKNFHEYLQPDREIDASAQQVHGISAEFLADKPRFAEIAERFLAFVSGAELIIHNAPFDVGFLDAELQRWHPGSAELAALCQITDTLALARRRHPGQRNSLEALCKRYDVDDSHRELHGALLDAQILADVYLAMTGGQVVLHLDSEPAVAETVGPAAVVRIGARRAPLRVISATTEELAAHQARLQAVDEASAQGCLWLGGD